MKPASGITVEEMLAHAPWLRQLAGTLVAGGAAADDLVQETWLRALERPPRDAGAVRAWLARVARNLSHNVRRGQARRSVHESAVVSAEAELDPARIAEELEAQRVLAEAVLRLEEPLRSTVVLRWFRGLDSRAIARVQGVPEGTVRWRQKRALELLRADLDARFGERRAWLALLMPLSSRAPHPIQPSTGVLLMSATAKVAIAAAGVLVALVGLWIARGTGARPVATAEARAREPSGAGGSSAPPARVASLPERTQVARETFSSDAADPAGPAERECCIVGRVLDVDGRGLAGARVVARTARLAETLRSRTRLDEAVVATTSGADGAYALEVPGQRPFVLTATYGEHAPASSLLAFAGERRDLTLVPGTVLAVRASDEGAAPVAGARVRVVFEIPGADGELWSAEATTGPDGRAELRGLPEGKGRVEGRRESLRGVRAIDVDGRTSETCSLVLYGTGRIEGRVFERDTGRPIAGARVGAAASGVEEVVTDSSGRYALERVALGEGLWILEAHARGRAGRFEVLRLTPKDNRRTVDFALDPAARAAGRVLDAERRALAGARVVFLGTQPVEPMTAATDRSEATTDARGAFAVDGLLPGVAYRVLALAPGQPTGVFACGPIAPGSAPVDLGELVLGLQGSIAGEAGGAPGAAGPWDVELHWSDPDAATQVESFGLVETTRADPRGRFAFTGLLPGRYRLALLDPETKRSTVLEEGLVELAPGERRAGVVLRPGGRAIRGTLARGGKIRCRVRLFALAEPEVELRETFTDGEGRFRLAAPEPGPFRVVFDELGLLYESRIIEPVEAGTVDLFVELAEFRSTHAIRGVVTVEGAPAPADLFISFWSSGTGERLGRVAFLDVDGRFEMENLRDEPYDVGVLDFENRFEPVRVPRVRPDGEALELALVRKP